MSEEIVKHELYTISLYYPSKGESKINRKTIELDSAAPAIPGFIAAKCGDDYVQYFDLSKAESFVVFKNDADSINALIRAAESR